MNVSGDESADSNDRLLNDVIYIMDQMRAQLLFASLGVPFLARKPKYYKTIRLLRKFVTKLIEQHMSHATNDVIDDTKSHKFIDTVVQCLRDGLFTTEDVITECFTMIVASLETSTLGTYSTLSFLAMHPEVQERLFQEIKTVFPKKNTPVDYEHLKHLPYLDMVWAETMRLTPPIPFIGRQASQATELKPGLIVPKGMQVVIPIVNVHRSKRFWGECPERFDPERFTPENIEKRPPYAYIPFSKGPRNCIGFRYADIANRINIIYVVRNFKLSTTFKLEDLVLLPRVSLEFATEPRLSFERRQ